MNKILTTSILFLVTTFSANSQISVASIFSDNMVLQRNVKIPVWGLATTNEKITVQFHNQTKTTKADKFGKWDICSPQTVADFTAIGYFYAKELNQKLNVPIGIINAS